MEPLVSSHTVQQASATRAFGTFTRPSSGHWADRSDISAPDHYVWCSDVPLDMSDEHEWDGCVVVEEGSGRDGKKTSTSGLES